jgi:uncharacterized protein YcbX
MAKIHSIYRYPIKGLSPEALPRVALKPGETVPGDRLYAIENGPSGFDPVQHPYLSKQHFLMLMKNERLAGLRTLFDQSSHTLTIDQGPRAAARGDLRTPAGRAAIEAFFAAYCADELRGPPRILHAPGHSFSDVARKVVSIINLASVAAVETMVDAPVNPLRFRGNIYVEGWPAWSEFDLVGKELTVNPPPHAGEESDEARGGCRSDDPRAPVRLKIVKRIVRCAATNVDPDTALRDLNTPKALLCHLGHADCGIYAEVIAAGEIAAGDTLEIL